MKLRDLNEAKRAAAHARPVTPDQLAGRLRHGGVETANKTPPARVGRPSPRDTQRRRLYSWEVGAACPSGSRKGLVPGPRTFPADIDGAKLLLDLNEAQGIIDLVCALWEIEPPAVLDGRSRRRAAYFDRHPNGTAGGAIALPRWARTPWVVLHEVTHALVAHTGDPHIEDHGPEFVATYILLLGVVLEADTNTLRSSARAYGLRVGVAASRIGDIGASR